MYLDFFGLKKSPFKITPDPELFFSGGKRGEILEAIVYAITSGAGITKVVGEVGSGKTMLCRMLEDKLPKEIQIVYIANPSLSAENILPIIALELGLQFHTKSKVKIMRFLQIWLLRQHSEGKQVVIFVEEAQCMPNETLEEIRLLSNLETNEDKLLQIVLFGQPELDENLEKHEIRQLKDRISNSFLLGDFTVEEIEQYLKHRMHRAGYRGPSIFTKGAVKGIAKYSKGLIRRVNILADKALLAAFASGKHTIKAKHVELAGIDSQFKEKETHSKLKLVMASIIFASIFSSLTTYFIIKFGPSNINEVSSSIQKIVEPTTQEKPVDKNKVEPITEEVVIEEVVIEEVVTEENKQVVEEEIALESDFEEVFEQGNGLIEMKERLEKTNQWLLNINPEYSIQLQLFSSKQIKSKLNDYLQSIASQINLEEVFVYRSDKNGKVLYGVLYGTFDGREEAKEAVKKLPKSIKKSGPFIRTLNSLKRNLAGR